jgi:PAS domain S-box-containing protein
MVSPINISDQSKEDLLRLLDAYQKATLETILCSITDTEGKIIYANKIFCDVSQYSIAELLGENHRIVNAAFHPPEFFKELWDTISAGKAWRGEVKNRAKDGSYYWLDSVIVPIKDASGKIIQYFSLRTLINEKKKAEEDQEAHIRALESMLFMISHKVRHPIANILSIASVFEEYANSPEEILKMISFIKDEAMALDSFTRELTGFIYDLDKKNKLPKKDG